MPPEKPVRLPSDPCVEIYALADGRQAVNAHLRARQRPERAVPFGNALPDAERGVVYAGNVLKPARERVRQHFAETVGFLRRENDPLAVNALRRGTVRHDTTSDECNKDIGISCVLY